MAQESGRRLFHAPLIVDGDGRRHAPGAILIEDNAIIAAGSPQMVGESSEIEPVRLSRHLLVPGLVNAHAHLDLTHIGPMPFNGSFTEWVGAIRGGRAQDDDATIASVRRGIALSRVGGTAIIGDIAGVGSYAPSRAMRRFGMAGVSYIEVFGLTRGLDLAKLRMQEAIEQLSIDEGGVRIGLQPHAPYSCDVEVYRVAAELATHHELPLATHLAETREEIRFIRSQDGPIAEMLQEIGVWRPTDRQTRVLTDSAVADGSPEHPIDLLAPVLSSAPFLLAHVNYAEDRHIEMLTRWPISIAYCPRASSYFGHGLDQPHRYGDMIQAGLNVALGTDSIVCLGTSERISVLDEMRFLYRRDSTDPEVLLRMGTVASARALGFDPDLVTFKKGPVAGLLALSFDPEDGRDPLVSAMMRYDSPDWLLQP